MTMSVSLAVFCGILGLVVRTGDAACYGPCLDDTNCDTGITCQTVDGLPRCCDVTTVATTTVATTTVTSTSSNTTSSTTCVDAITTCSAYTAYCTNANYRNLMIDRCPVTCGLCGATRTSTSSSSSSTSCVDLTKADGTSDCPSRAYLCNDTTYYTLMTQQCPRTCGRCNSTSSSSSSSSTCVDLTKADGTSDCTALSYLCNSTVYYTLMTTQCPRTCGRCSTTATSTTSSVLCYAALLVNGAYICPSALTLTGTQCC
uniref:ShKT domain-containing protein n=1 Tax=Panagrellus redivivus TaxID=6233 RepID=A0A7E4ULM2_PANRE